MLLPPLDIVIPVYNEQPAVVRQTLAQLKEAFSGRPAVRIIVVNDGSDPSYGLTILGGEDGITYLEHERNRGYGSALKTGILEGNAPWIAILDADGTYPVSELSAMVEQMANADMVVGVRTGPVCNIDLSRRVPKKLLNLFASYIAGTRIADLNSGMRVFSRDLCYYLWGFYPKRFSFTSTITMGALMGGFRVRDFPINYYRRRGKSSIHPLRDTLAFFRLIFRLGLLFDPMKIFGPVAGAILGFGLLKGVMHDYWIKGSIGNITQTSVIAGIQIFMIGLIGKLIVLNRGIRPRQGEIEARIMPVQGSIRRSHLEQAETARAVNE